MNNKIPRSTELYEFIVERCLEVGIRNKRFDADPLSKLACTIQDRARNMGYGDVTFKKLTRNYLLKKGLLTEQHVVVFVLSELSGLPVEEICGWKDYIEGKWDFPEGERHPKLKRNIEEYLNFLIQKCKLKSIYALTCKINEAINPYGFKINTGFLYDLVHKNREFFSTQTVMMMLLSEVLNVPPQVAVGWESYSEDKKRGKPGGKQDTVDTKPLEIQGV